MTAIRVKEEYKTILDFSKSRCSRSGVNKALRQCDLTSLVMGETFQDSTFLTNEIKVGMYNIQLHLPIDYLDACHKLKDYGDFEITISGSNHDKIDLKKDCRFKDQYWVPYNFFGKLRIKHLTDAILHCKRLDNLKAFL